MRQVCPPRPRGQKWATFLQNHAANISGIWGPAIFYISPMCSFDLCWLLGTSVLRKEWILRTDVPRSQHRGKRVMIPSQLWAFSACLPEYDEGKPGDDDAKQYRIWTRCSQDLRGILGTLAEPTGTDGFRLLCHQFFPSCLSRRAHCLRRFSTCFLKRNQLREALLL